MELTKELLDSFTERFGSPLYLFDEEGFLRNYQKLYEAMTSLYPNYKAAYSFKTNYTPYICSLVKETGGYAEVVSGLEYSLAKKIGFEDHHIIFNGPDKEKEGLETFHKGSIINIDSLDELELFCKEAESSPDETFKIGLRANLDLGQDFVSRFGLDRKDIAEAFKRVSCVKNLTVSGLHCHISRCRDKEAWRKRTEYMLSIADAFFKESPEYIDLGSGMYGSMAPEFAAQFTDVPTYQEYAEVTAGLIRDHYKGKKEPLFFTEPGTTLINRFVSCAARVISVKQINGHHFAVLNCSIHNLGETSILKRLPVEVIACGEAKQYYDSIDLTGYTCLEQDVLLKNYTGCISKGDYVIFGNTGGYSTVLKPPFIRPDCAMVVFKKNGEAELIKAAQSFEVVLSNYLL